MAYTTIDNPELYMQCKIYTGNGSADHAITLDGSEDMQPDMVWIKNRQAETSDDPHTVFDSVRGVTKHWRPNVNESETTDADTLDAFQTNGFKVDADTKVNTNAEKYVAWCWKESATAGFDILTYVGNHTSGRTVAHGLSAVPEYMIIKNLNSAEKPAVYHKGSDTASPEDYLMVMSDTSARLDDLSFLNDTAPTSSIFTLGNTQGISESGSTMVAYLWRSVQGYSKFGSYEGNSSTNGTFVYLGFRPSYVLTKRATGGTGGWYLWDNKRNGFNGSTGNIILFPHHESLEGAGTTQRIDLLSNGFKFRHADSDHNGSGSQYMFIAFAEQPLVNSNGVPCNAR